MIEAVEKLQAEAWLPCELLGPGGDMITQKNLAEFIARRLDDLIGWSALLEACKKVEAWLLGLAEQAEARAKDSGFQTLVDANRADARNYRAVARDLRVGIAQAEPEKE